MTRSAQRETPVTHRAPSRRARRALAALALLAGVLFPAAQAQAGLQVVPGLKLWHNTWEYEGSRGVHYTDSSLMVGPSLKISYDALFAGFTYMSTLWDYNLRWTDYRIETPRTDVDLMAGYALHENVSCLLGFKHITYDDNIYFDNTWNTHSTVKANALLLGVSVVKPLLDTGLIVNANLSGGLYRGSSKIVYEAEGAEDHYDSLLRLGKKGYLTSFEVGASFPAGQNSYLNVSYKNQQLVSTGGEAKDKMFFKGFIFSADYLF